MKQRASRRLAVEKGQDRLEARLGPEAVPAQILFGRDHRIRGPLEHRQRLYKPEQKRDVLGGRAPNRNLPGAHRSRHSRAPLPGGPKSRGAIPEWNQVTKL